MSLESTLTDIVARLRQGRFPNEQAISQGIVLRELANGDPTFRERCSQHPDAQGRKCPYSPRTRRTLSRPVCDFAINSESLSGNLSLDRQIRLKDTRSNKTRNRRGRLPLSGDAYVR